MGEKTKSGNVQWRQLDLLKMMRDGAVDNLRMAVIAKTREQFEEMCSRWRGVPVGAAKEPQAPGKRKAPAKPRPGAKLPKTGSARAGSSRSGRNTEEDDNDEDDGEDEYESTSALDTEELEARKAEEEARKAEEALEARKAEKEAHKAEKEARKAARREKRAAVRQRHREKRVRDPDYAKECAPTPVDRVRKYTLYVLRIRMKEAFPGAAEFNGSNLVRLKLGVTSFGALSRATKLSFGPWVLDVLHEFEVEKPPDLDDKEMWHWMLDLECDYLQATEKCNNDAFEGRECHEMPDADILDICSAAFKKALARNRRQ